MPAVVSATVGVRPVITARAISVSSTTPSERAMMRRERIWRCQTAGSIAGRLLVESAAGLARSVGGAGVGWVGWAFIVQSGWAGRGCRRGRG